MLITDDGEFQSSVIKESVRTYASQVASFLHGRQKVNNLAEGDDTFCTMSDVVKAGYLDKRGSWFKGYKKRYFILRGDKALLTYFDSSNSLHNTLGAIYLSKDTVITEVVPNDDIDRFEFVVKTPEFTRLEMGEKKEITEKPTEILLRAKNEEDRTLWMEDILERCTALKGQHQQKERSEMVEWWEMLFEDNNLAANLGSDKQRRKGIFTVPENSSEVASTTNTGTAEDAGGGGKKEEAEEAPPQTGTGTETEEEVAHDSQASPRLSEPSHTSQHKDVGMSAKDTDTLADDMTEVHIEGQFADRSISGEEDKDKEEEEEEEHEDLALDHINIVSEEDERELLKYKHARKSSSAAKFKHPKDSAIQKAPLTSSTLEAFSFMEERRNDVVEGEAAGTATATTTAADVVGGFQICLDLRHMLFDNERVFAVVFGKRMTAKGSLNQSAGLKELSRTEVVVVRGGVSYGVAIVKCQIAFTLIQTKIPDDIEHLVISVWKVDQIRDDNVQQNLSSALCYRSFNVRHMKDKRVFSSSMKTNMNAIGDPSDEIKAAHLGIVQIQSALLREAGMSMRNKMPLKPYTETMSAFRSVRGYALCVEQIFTSTYGVMSSIGMLKFFIDEKEPILRVNVATSELEHENAVTDSESRKYSNSRYSRRSSVDKNRGRSMYSEHLGQAFSDLTDDLFLEDQAAAVETYRKIYDEGVCDLEAILYMYTNATAGASALDREKNIQNVVSGEMGGGFLRRSSWKKASLWQYVTTNLNVHMLISKVLSDEEIIKNAEQARELCDDSITFNPVITLGVPAAHGMKFSKGGLRRMFIEAGFTDASARAFWMHAIQNAQLKMTDLFEMARARNESAQFAKLMGDDKRGSLNSRTEKETKTESETEKVNTVVMLAKRRFLLSKRVEICVSQILGFACTLVHTVIQLATLQPHSKYMEILHLSLKTGFLVPLQSLLSTQGDEQGMIEDMDAAVLFLRDVKMKVMREIHEDHKIRRKVEFKRGEMGKLVVYLFLRGEEADLVDSITKTWVEIDKKEGRSTSMAPSMISCISGRSSVYAGGSKVASGMEEVEFDDLLVEEEISNVDLVSVFMNQGVNEWQSVAGNFGYKSVDLQVVCNQENLDILSEYMAVYKDNYLLLASSRSQPHSQTKRNIAHLNMALDEVTRAVEANRRAPKQKHVSILTTFAFLCRNLCGTVGILCKSGKDRTGMSSTLELVRSLMEEVALIHPEVAVQALRETGGRRMNVWANTGQGFFAFNGLQRSYLPACYRPPMHTYSAKVAS